MQFKQVSHEVKELDDAKGIVIAYANVYNNVDSDKDVIVQGAFTKTVQENFKRIRVLKDHDPKIGLGVPLSIDTTDPYGLLTTTQFNLKKEVARDMYEDVKLFIGNGLNAELSIGFQTIKSMAEKSANDENINKITEVKLWEYSFLSNWAANEMAVVQGVKNKKEDAIELLVKMYNLPYSDSRLKQIEALLISLESEPLQSNTPIDEPIVDEAKELFNYLTLKGVLKNGN